MPAPSMTFGGTGGGVSSKSVRPSMGKKNRVSKKAHLGLHKDLLKEDIRHGGSASEGDVPISYVSDGALRIHAAKSLCVLYDRCDRSVDSLLAMHDRGASAQRRRNCSRRLVQERPNLSRTLVGRVVGPDFPTPITHAVPACLFAGHADPSRILLRSLHATCSVCA